jgi:hypothetical protein
MWKQDPKKQTWMKELVSTLEPELSERYCIFTDITYLCSLEPVTCAAHGACKVSKQVFLTHCGSSCINFSKLFQGDGNSSRSEILRDILKDGKGKSGDTFQGMMWWLNEARLDMHSRDTMN